MSSDEIIEYYDGTGADGATNDGEVHACGRMPLSTVVEVKQAAATVPEDIILEYDPICSDEY